VVADGELDDVDDLGVVGQVDLSFSFAAGAYQAGEFEFAQVLADRGHGLSGFGGEGADVTFA
jgi:hypothetical protein